MLILGLIYCNSSKVIFIFRSKINIVTYIQITKTFEGKRNKEMHSDPSGNTTSKNGRKRLLAELFKKVKWDRGFGYYKMGQQKML